MTVRILIPRERRHGRLPRYVSAATQSLAATFTPGSGTGGQTTTVALNLTPATNPNCKASNAGTVCELSFDLVRGPYTASFSTYDGLLGPNHLPTGNVLSANVAFAVTIEPNATIPVALYGVPVSIQMTPQSGGQLVGSLTAGFTLPVNETGYQQLTVTGFDADGNAIVGAGAPVPALSTSDPYLKLTSPASSAPNLFGLQLTGSPAVGHVAGLSVAVTPAAASGEGPVTSSATLTFTQPITITEFAIPAGSRPGDIVAGPDGALWFTEIAGNEIGRITTAGSVTQFPVPTAVSSPKNIVAGPDGALWFTETAGNKIGRITTAGSVTEYSTASSPFGIAAGPDGALWFTEPSGDAIGRITTAGNITEYPIFLFKGQRKGQPSGVAAGPDSAIWFTESDNHLVGRITTMLTGGYILGEYFMKAGDPFKITSGPDDALWFTEPNSDKIGRVTTAGSISQYAVPTAFSYPADITLGPDGALWFTETLGNNVGRITATGNITEYPVPTDSSGPAGITAGPDGALWFVENTGNKIGRLGFR